MLINRITLEFSKFMLGGSVYYMLEMLIRQRSHWTMFVLGGLCFVICGIIDNIFSDSINIWEKMVWCMVTITVSELIVGLIVNVVLGWQIWDYTRMPFQVMGQICVPFMLLWYFVSLPAILLSRLCDRLVVFT
ncbi:MAG: hypothetical protein E7265_07995 [Lachnospiraceae bacterium]|nr:hypothetical protein [Lachnospiraceae bacterium]